MNAPTGLGGFALQGAGPVTFWVHRYPSGLSSWDRIIQLWVPRNDGVITQNNKYPHRIVHIGGI
ncbi:MAG: hypothetical protein ACE5R6_19260 [Candidatus Heimdallarchaeota archaeon]